MRFSLTLLGLTCVAASTKTRAQQLPAVRPVGPVVQVSAPGLLSSASSARQYPDGRVMLVDLLKQRVVILDSTLKHVQVVGNPVGSGSSPSPLAGNIPFLGDSALLVHLEALAFLVVDKNGRVGRTFAIPRPRDVAQLFGGPYGTPGFDRQGRLIYRASAWLPLVPPATDGPSRGPSESDSAAIVRLDFKTRKLDTLALYRIVTHNVTQRRTSDGRFAISVESDPMPVSDEWAVLSDGTVAIIRGQDYHVDWIAPDGAKHSTPRLPYGWVRMDDVRKAAFRDSVIAKQAEDVAKLKKANPQLASSHVDYVFAPVDKMSDYLPAFGNTEIRGGIVRADRDDNLWIRTNTVIGGRPVYDVVNRRGVLVDRVSLPYGRIIVGFGAKTVIMAVLDNDSALLEVARMR